MDSIRLLSLGPRYSSYTHIFPNTEPHQLCWGDSEMGIGYLMLKMAVERLVGLTHVVE